MADNFSITQGSGTTVATDQLAGGEHVQKIKLLDPTPDSNAGIGIASNPMRIDPTGTTTQPISGSVSVSNFPASTEISNDSGNPVPVSGTVTANAGSGTFAVSNASLPLPAGASTSALQTTGNASLTSIDSKLTAVKLFPNTLTVTAVGAASAAVTATLPAVAGQFHFIDSIEITKYAAVAVVGGATPVTVTTTNLGSVAYTFASAAAIGTADVRNTNPSRPLQSAAANTATTIVCPATTNIIWRVTVYYYAA